MKRLLGLAVASAVCLTLVQGVEAATWTKVGSAGLIDSTDQSDGLGYFRGYQRIKYGSIVVDGAGNIYVAYHYKERGGLTIFKTNNTRIDIDLSSLNLPGKNGAGLTGPITKLVVAGDGLVYGLMNWTEIHWNWGRDYANRIVQITPSGNVQTIWFPDADNNGQADIHTTVNNDAMIADIAVNSDDGNLYWVMNGSSNYWRWRFMWQYDVAAETVDCARLPGNLSNDGRSAQFRQASLAYVEDGWFALLRSGGNGSQAWTLEHLRYIPGQPRGINDSNGNPVREGTAWPGENALASPGFGRNWATVVVYDAQRNRLWAGGRGNGGNNATNIMTRWNGSNTYTGLFEPLPAVPTASLIKGIASVENWHTNGNDPLAGTQNFQPTGSNFGYWLSGAAVNPASGALWFSIIASPAYIGNDMGSVLVRHPDYPQILDAGKPDPAGAVMGVTIKDGVAYALVVELATGTYSVYTTNDLSESPQSLGIGDLKKASGTAQTDAAKVVTLPYPNALGYQFFYLQNPDRSSGIRVDVPNNSSISVASGDRVGVQGVVFQKAGEAVISSPVLLGQETGDVPVALRTAIKNLGGDKFGLQKAVPTHAGQNSVGLLVHIVGKLVESPSADFGGLYFRLDDGSNIKFGSSTVAGVKVYGFSPSTNIGDMIEAQGVVGTQVDGSTLVPVIYTLDTPFPSVVAP